MLGRNQLLADLSGILLNKSTRDVDKLLRIAVGMGDFQFCSCTHQLQKPGKQSDIGAGKGINGLPVITHRHYFGLRDL